MKIKYEYIIYTVLLFLVGFAIWIGIGLHFETKVIEFRSDTLWSLQANVLDIHCIPYNYLDEKYTVVVTEEQYLNANTPEKILNIYETFNGIYYELELTTRISTDDWKISPLGIIEIDGNKYRLMHHIDFVVFHFKPKVVKWCVEITPIE